MGFINLKVKTCAKIVYKEYQENTKKAKGLQREKLGWGGGRGG